MSLTATVVSALGAASSYRPTTKSVFFSGTSAGAGVEDLTIVGRVDHHAVHHRPPVNDRWLEEPRLLFEPLEDGRRDEVLDLNEQLILLPRHPHVEPAVLTRQ